MDLHTHLIGSLHALAASGSVIRLASNYFPADPMLEYPGYSADWWSKCLPEREFSLHAGEGHPEWKEDSQ